MIPYTHTTPQPIVIELRGNLLFIEDDKHHRNVIEGIMEPTANYKTRRSKKHLISNTFVIRGDQTGKVQLRMSTWHEYLFALYRMAKDLVPQLWVNPMAEHSEYFVNMAGE